MSALAHPEIFKAYDVRGLYGKEIDVEVAHAIGRAFAQVKGTGLGLFIVREIMRRHGGEITAESEGEGKGSTFIIRLPRAER